MAEEGGTAEEEVAEPEPVPVLGDEEVQARQKIWEAIFEDCPADKAKLASVTERKANAQEGIPAFAYSELDFATVNNMINLLKNQHTRLYAGKGIFCDLGSGAGKACLAAGLCHPWEKVIGIEMMQSLTDIAMAANAKYQENEGPEGYTKPECQFIKGDFVTELATHLEPVAQSLAVVLAVAACYGEEQLGAMASLAEKMADNSIFITISQELPDSVIGGDKKLPAERYRDRLKEALAVRGTDPDTVDIDPSPPDEKPGGWRQVHTEKIQLAWGSTILFVFKKLPLPEEPKPEGEEAPPAPEE